MATFTFVCPHCGEVFDQLVLTSIGEKKEEVACPKCATVPCNTKIGGMPGVRYRGDGYYCTDSK